jgi:hypothetical protein
MQTQFNISPEIFEKCSNFAKASVDSSSDKYARRNQFNVEKIIQDIRNGKIGEEGVHSLLLEKLPNLNSPDHNIYDKFNKSWDPDLKDEKSNISIAVKSQNISSAIEFGESWVFQFNEGKNYDCDNGIFKEIDDKHYVAFVALNVPKRKGEIKAIVKVQWLHDKKLFKAMQKQNLRGNKVAVYFDDLELFKDELFQL